MGVQLSLSNLPLVIRRATKRVEIWEDPIISTCSSCASVSSSWRLLVGVFVRTSSIIASEDISHSTELALLRLDFVMLGDGYARHLVHEISQVQHFLLNHSQRIELLHLVLVQSRGVLHSI